MTAISHLTAKESTTFTHNSETPYMFHMKSYFMAYYIGTKCLVGELFLNDKITHGSSHCFALQQKLFRESLLMLKIPNACCDFSL